MSRKYKLAYERISDGARFREQYRFVFSAAVIATVFIMPNSNSLEIFLKATLGFSAFFAALYLIASAARVKYAEPGRLYEIFYVGEHFRMWAYDWSIHVFAVALLFFIGLVVTGLIGTVPGVDLDELWSWVVFIGVTLVTGLIILLITQKVTSRKPKKALPRI